MLEGTFRIEDNGGKQNLTYLLDEGERLDRYTYGMLNNNKIERIAPVAFVQLNEQRELKFDITGYETVAAFLRGAPMNNVTLLTIFAGVLEAIAALESFGIATSSMLISADIVYIKVGGSEQRLICLPLQETVEAPDFGAFFKQVLSDANFAPGESTSCRMELLNYLNRPEPFVLAEFRKKVDKFYYGSYHTAQPAGNPQAERAQVRRPEPAHAPRPATPVPQSKPALKPTPAPATKSASAAVAERPAQPSSFAIPGGGGNFAIPGAQPRAQAPKPEPKQKQAQSTGAKPKEASLGYLLMHYSSDTLAAYKAAKQGGGASAQPAPTQAPKGEKRKEASLGHLLLHFSSDTLAEYKAAKQQSKAVQVDVPAPAEQAATSFAANHDFGYTMRLEREDVDAEMDAAPTAMAYLLRKSTGETIRIDAPEFSIGSEAHNQYVLQNQAISRRHAKITCRGEEYFITDHKSLNYTRVNGKLLQPNEPEPLLDGAWIKLANEDFEFHIE
jgi:hypothetical protein